MEQVYDYTVQEGYTSTPYTTEVQEEIKSYIDSVLGTKSTESTFGLSDMLADADAIAIYTILDSGKDLCDAIYNYYYKEYKCKERYSYFSDYLLDLADRAPYIEDITSLLETKTKVAYLFISETNPMYSNLAAAIISWDKLEVIPVELQELLSSTFSQYIENNM